MHNWEKDSTKLVKITSLLSTFQCDTYPSIWFTTSLWYLDYHIGVLTSIPPLLTSQISSHFAMSLSALYSDLLSSITQYLPFEAILNLFSCGNRKFNMIMRRSVHHFSYTIKRGDYIPVGPLAVSVASISTNLTSFHLSSTVKRAQSFIELHPWTFLPSTLLRLSLPRSHLGYEGLDPSIRFPKLQYLFLPGISSNWTRDWFPSSLTDLSLGDPQSSRTTFFNLSDSLPLNLTRLSIDAKISSDSTCALDLSHLPLTDVHIKRVLVRADSLSFFPKSLTSLSGYFLSHQEKYILPPNSWREQYPLLASIALSMDNFNARCIRPHCDRYLDFPPTLTSVTILTLFDPGYPWVFYPFSPAANSVHAWTLALSKTPIASSLKHVDIVGEDLFYHIIHENGYLSREEELLRQQIELYTFIRTFRNLTRLELDIFPSLYQTKALPPSLTRITVSI